MEQAFRRSIHEAREHGQTVFLSSHILSEVEALCEEDAGRWGAAGRGADHPARRGAVGQALAGLGTGAAVLWALTAAITVVVVRLPRIGIPAGPALFFSIAVVAPAVMFLATGDGRRRSAPWHCSWDSSPSKAERR